MSKILQISTRHPENILDSRDKDAQQIMKSWWEENGYSGRVFDRYMPITGNDTRHTCFPVETILEQSKSFTVKNKIFNEVVVKLSLECVKELNFDPQDVCMITSTTMTGVGIPTVPHALLTEFDFPESLVKIPMFGLACNGGTHVLAIADEYLKGNPDKLVIALTTDLCSLSLCPEFATFTCVFGSAIFGDGIGAIVIAGDDYKRQVTKHLLLGQEGWKILKHRSYVLPDTEDHITLEGREDGLSYNVESTKLQEIPKESLEVHGKVKEFIEGHTIDNWICHPGGKIVMENTINGLGLPNNALDSSFEMFRQFGNMSATSVIKTLEHDFDKTGKTVMISYGPGFQIDLMLLEKI